MHKQVAIVGAGPSGLFLARMFANRGVDFVLLENRNEAFLRKLNRGGYLSDDIATLVQQECKSSYQPGRLIEKLEWLIDGETYTSELSDNCPVIYDQRALVADMLQSLKDDDVDIIWEAKAQRYEGLTEDRVKIIYTLQGQIHNMTCDYVIGCDGYRGISRRSIPKDQRNEVLEELPLAWLEWIGDKDESIHHPIISISDDGFAMVTPDSQDCTRYYMQIDRGLEKDDLPAEDEIWKDIKKRLGLDIYESGMTNMKIDYMRYFHTDKLQHGRLFIAGDAAHQVPRYGSKGMNLALQDAYILGVALEQAIQHNDNTPLSKYTDESRAHSIPILESTKLFNELVHSKKKADRQMLIEYLALNT